MQQEATTSDYRKLGEGYDLRKYYFTNRVVNMWNSLSSYVVSAKSVNCFKNRRDNVWKDQEIIYNFRAEIYGTGNRSECSYSLIALGNSNRIVYVKIGHRDYYYLSPNFLYVSVTVIN